MDYIDLYFCSMRTDSEASEQSNYKFFSLFQHTACKPISPHNSVHSTLLEKEQHIKMTSFTINPPDNAINKATDKSGDLGGTGRASAHAQLSMDMYSVHVQRHGLTKMTLSTW